MKCELCGMETEFGNPYCCYYGTFIRAESSTGPADYSNVRTQTTISTHRMGGEKSAWFCDRCVASGYGKEQRNPSIYGCLVISLVVCCSLSALVVNLGENLSALAKVVILFALVLGLGALFPLVRGIRALSAANGDPNGLRSLLADDREKDGMITAFGDGLVLKREKDGLMKLGFDSFFTRKNKPVPVQTAPQ
jgi:hypothetical protein